MSDFIDELCVPVVYIAHDDTRFEFRPMLGKHWKALTSQYRAERLAIADAEITASADSASEKVSWKDRQEARENARARIIRETNIDAMLHYCRYDVEGIEKLLAFATTDCGTDPVTWARYSEVMPMPRKVRIAEEIVYTPARKPHPQKPPQAADAGVGQSKISQPENSTGESASDTSTSSEKTPTS